VLTRVFYLGQLDRRLVQYPRFFATPVTLLALFSALDHPLGQVKTLLELYTGMVRPVLQLCPKHRHKRKGVNPGLVIVWETQLWR
jgi:hypothetical protein